MLDDRSFEPIAHAIAGRRYLPLAVEKQGDRFVAELIILRSEHDTDRTGDSRGQIDPAFRPKTGLPTCRRNVQFVAGLQGARKGAAEAHTRIHRKASEHRLPPPR